MVLARVCQLVGALILAQFAWRIANAIYMYFIRAPDLPTYLYPSTSGVRPWALVTGSSDGIGKAIASQLYQAGFSVYLHGRNADKLELVKKEILSLPANSVQTLSNAAHDVKIWIQDAAAAEIDYDNFARTISTLHLTVVVHNVGGSEAYTKPFHAQTQQELDKIININARWLTQLTRVLIPILNSVDGPKLMVNIGSFAGSFTAPYLAAYCGSKAFVRIFTRTMCADNDFMRNIGKGAKHPIRYQHIGVGSVRSGTNLAEIGFGVPEARDFARDLLRHMGGPDRDFAASPAQALQEFMIKCLPQQTAELAIGKVMRQQYKY
ncbi:uncharacterized protein L969DRAFT_96505 [Mixia osmundae IAM 14324]|uniref:NAD(P)-binding protein n=1 Tax=Mixia osmundae (strain CBS 9802 / IAM 14324 / JCM 22182 / KY 12970) TaxID=764103 RepID=G7DUU5_MIXOS|nr:uncharacterized protein L969DRAFT_96505 [Mixia osmundae IAM 14324]KEI37427.1 hypothetical protein L969DRAFT_96505 [Mixia osmundae IAM 14324]GAA94355.1 hypothetical protein E5Q_01006 [Mixia osmundae IAM 14324]